MSGISISSKTNIHKEFPTSFKGQVTVRIERNAQETVKSLYKRLVDILVRGDKICEIITGFGKLIQITTGESDQKELQLNIFTKLCSKS